MNKFPNPTPEEHAALKGMVAAIEAVRELGHGGEGNPALLISCADLIYDGQEVLRDLAERWEADLESR